jgi:broad specificity phosphatase PhoE
MTTRVILLCHAATAATRAGRFPADEEIEAAAAAILPGLAVRLPHGDAVVCGRERRAVETSAALGLPARPVADLDDWALGGWRGRDLADVAGSEPEAFSAWRSDPAGAPHGGESLVALVERVAGWLESCTATRRVIAVTHPAVLRAAVVHALAVPVGAFWRIDAGPLALADLRHDGRRWALRSVALDAF